MVGVVGENLDVRESVDGYIGDLQELKILTLISQYMLVRDKIILSSNSLL